jgi:hypothetical protein
MRPAGRRGGFFIARRDFKYFGENAKAAPEVIVFSVFLR